MRRRVLLSSALFLALSNAVSQARAEDPPPDAEESVAAPAAASDIASPQSQQDLQRQQEILVSGSRSGFGSGIQTTGTRAQRPLRDVPQAITVVPASVLTSTGARRVEDVAHLVPSVQLGAGFGSVWDDYYVRGSRVWSGTMYRNGYLGGYSNVAATDAVNVERVEVLRGPAAALYGPGLPGGTINIVTKRPERERSERLTVGFGSFETQRLTLDVTGPLSPRVAYRVTAGFDDTAGYRDFNESERLILNPSFAYELGEDTRWLVESQIFRVRYRPDPGGVPTVNGDPFALPRERSYVEPNTPLTRFDGALLRSEVSHRVSDHVMVRFGVQRQQALSDERALYPLGVDADGQLARINTHMSLHAEDVAVQGGIEISGNTWGLEHDAVLGVDARYEHVTYRLGTSDPGAEPFLIDVNDPRYGSRTPAIIEPTGPESRWTYADTGVYLNDVMRPVEWLRFVLGGRLDRYRQTSRTGGADVEEGEEVAPSGRVGVIVDVTDVGYVFANHSRGFWPVLGVSATGALLEPETSSGFEFGGRYDLGEVEVEATYFSVENDNISVPDPEHPEFQVQRGASLTEGIELGATAQLSDVFRAIGSYTMSDAEITEDVSPDLVGTPLVMSSRHSGGVWLEATAPVAEQHVVVGFGARGTGERPLNDGTTVPGYARLDASLGVLARFGVVRLFASNLLNRDYVQSGNDAGSVLRGAPRSFFVSLESSP